MSNLALRLKRLWVDWCEHNKPDPDGTPWPAEAFLQWAARELRCELVAVLGDDAQCALLRELAPHVQESWPAPAGDHEHPTDPDCKRPSSMAPPIDDDTADALIGVAFTLGELLTTPSHHLGAPLPMQRISSERTDTVQRGKLAAGSTLELGYQLRTHASITWLEAKQSPFSLLTSERVFVTSVKMRDEEQLAVPRVLLRDLAGRQNEGLIRFRTVGPGDAIRISMKNDSDTDLDVELRLHGVEPVKESETA